ncbi:hypothetical protein ON010_g10944 [Phytophthora cinnamomi]|nr:hypothetical protein ON010_g10944 [Phytophthora cinnamomi]
MLYICENNPAFGTAGGSASKLGCLFDCREDRDDGHDHQHRKDADADELRLRALADAALTVSLPHVAQRALRVLLRGGRVVLNVHCSSNTNTKNRPSAPTPHDATEREHSPTHRRSRPGPAPVRRPLGMPRSPHAAAG